MQNHLKELVELEVQNHLKELEQSWHFDLGLELLDCECAKPLRE